VDTRGKIVTAEAACLLARAGRPAALVTGCFDVLVPEHIRELARARDALPDCALVVAVTTPERPVMDARARAEMVAALGMVDYVVSSEESQIESLLEAFSAARIVRLETAHAQLMCELIQHVHRRQAR